MKILIVSPKFHPVIGGGETFAINSAERLLKMGHEVQVAVAPVTSRDASTYEYPLHEIEGLCDAPLDPLRACDGLFILLQKYQPDIIHVHGYFALLATYLANKQNVPVVASIHSTPVWNERIVGGMSGFEQEKQFAKRILFAARPKVVTAANDVYAVAARKIVENEIPVKEFPYPILPSFYKPHNSQTYRDKFRLTDTDTLLMVPSRIIERKGIREAVQALSFLPSNFYLCLPCAANQPADSLYWKDIQASKIYNSVAERVIVPNARILPDAMPSLYAASDIILMPSYYEGAPVATVEAMATRTPFIGADAQGINGFIKNMKNGLLVPQKNANILAEAILQLDSDPKLRARLVSNANQDVQHLSWDHQQLELVKLYKSLI